MQVVFFIHVFPPLLSLVLCVFLRQTPDEFEPMNAVITFG